MTDDEGEEWLRDNYIDLDAPEMLEYRVPMIDVINDKEKFKFIID